MPMTQQQQSKTTATITIMSVVLFFLGSGVIPPDTSGGSFMIISPFCSNKNFSHYTRNGMLQTIYAV
jgi:hypothetical protein